MSTYTALLDANILYPAPLRDLFLELGCTGIYRPRWTTKIHDEWMNALLRERPDRDRAVLERTRDLMNRSTPDCLVEGYEQLIPSLNLPDPDDRHVLAAAIVGKCEVIVTQNLKDFPTSALEPYGIEAQHPDDFLSNHLALAPGLFVTAVRTVLGRLRNPPYTMDEHLETLIRQGLVSTVSELRAFI